MKENFGKLDKLKSKKTIDQLFIEGKSIKNYPFKLIYIPLDNENTATLKTGVSVPKKLVKTAVQRNRIKRLMREVFRKNKYLVTNSLPVSYAIMIIYLSRDEIEYQKLSGSMIKLLEKFNEKLNEHEK
tara:strand:+ start:121 stop:504 length:384 start_codon:yes stop_codon:yes gene_type:complete